VKKRLFATTALTTFVAVGSASAADMPVKAPPAPAPAAVAAIPNWTGFYVGLNAGGAWGRSADPNTSTSCVAAPGFAFSYFNCVDVPIVDAAGTGSMSKAALIGGGQAGYNFQSNNAVYGIELDFDSFNIKAARQVTGNYATGGSFAITSSASTNWLFTARGRVGWAFGSLLPYATGGLAVTELNGSNSFIDNVGFPGPGVGTWSASATKLGWTVGGGLEWKLAQNWSAKVEYLYVKFGSVAASGAVVGSTGGATGYGSAISTSTDLTAQIARAGFNYKF
jgi:outer membrane immunogenic protein